MTTKNTPAEVTADVDALSPEPDVITLSSGFVVRVERLKTRGMFKLLKIITRGGGPILMNMPLDFNDQEVFVQQLLAVLVMAIPEAEDEALDFLLSVTNPVELDSADRTEAGRKANEELLGRLVRELENPEIEDTFSIIEKVIQNEAGDIQALGKRLAAVLKVQMASLGAKN